jgi:hypothetical protein
MLFRLSTREKLGVYPLLSPPRPMLAYALLQVNPEAAHAFAGDAEMDARCDRVYNRTRPAFHCRGAPPGPRLHGLGFYAHYYPQSATSPPHAEFLSALTGQDIPALVIKGRRDYLSWSSAREYLEALPDARLLYLDGPGTTPTRTSPSATWPGCGRSCSADRCLSARPRAAVLQRTMRDRPESVPPGMAHRCDA